MKWLLVFIIIGIDAPIYLEFSSSAECVNTGSAMQKQMSIHTKNNYEPYSTFACVEQE
jgi:hypothetical protein